MTVTTFKHWYLIHKWTSLVCTVVLLLLCLTGLPLVFMDELAVWLGEAVEPPEHVTAIAPISLQAFVDNARARRPQDHVQFLTLDDNHPAWFVSLATTPTAQENTGTICTMPAPGIPP